MGFHTFSYSRNTFCITVYILVKLGNLNIIVYLVWFALNICIFLLRMIYTFLTEMKLLKRNIVG